MPRNNGSSAAPVTTDSSIPVTIQRALRRVEGYVTQLRGVDEGQQAQIDAKLGSSKQDLLSLSAYMRNALQATGTHPLTIASLPGVAGEPQKIVPATRTTLGGVIIGSNINVTSDGTISVAAPSPPGVLSIRTVSVSTTLATTDYTVVFTAPSLVATLPPSPVTGEIHNVKNGNSVAGQTITVTAGGTVLIDASTTITLGATASLMVQWDGTQWRIL